MWAAHTFVNIEQLTIMKLDIPRPPHSPTAELSLPLEVATISSAWRVQPYWGKASSRKQPPCRRHGLSNILKLQAMLYSIYITNEQVKLISFMWEGVDFTLGIRYVALSRCSCWLYIYMGDEGRSPEVGLHIVCPVVNESEWLLFPCGDFLIITLIP